MIGEESRKAHEDHWSSKGSKCEIVEVEEWT